MLRSSPPGSRLLRSLGAFGFLAFLRSLRDLSGEAVASCLSRRRARRGRREGVGSCGGSVCWVLVRRLMGWLSFEEGWRHPTFGYACRVPPGRWLRSRRCGRLGRRGRLVGRRPMRRLVGGRVGVVRVRLEGPRLQKLMLLLPCLRGCLLTR